MQPESIYAVIITLVTVLGSAGAWRYYEKRAQERKEDEQKKRNGLGELYSANQFT